MDMDLLDGFPSRIHGLYVALLDVPLRRYDEDDREAVASLAQSPNLKRLMDMVPGAVPAAEVSATERLIFDPAQRDAEVRLQLGDLYGQLPDGYVGAALARSRDAWHKLKEPRSRVLSRGPARDRPACRMQDPGQQAHHYRRSSR